MTRTITVTRGQLPLGVLGLCCSLLLMVGCRDKRRGDTSNPPLTHAIQPSADHLSKQVPPTPVHRPGVAEPPAERQCQCPGPKVRWCVMSYFKPELSPTDMLNIYKNLFRECQPLQQGSAPMDRSCQPIELGVDPRHGHTLVVGFTTSCDMHPGHDVLDASIGFPEMNRDACSEGAVSNQHGRHRACVPVEFIPKQWPRRTDCHPGDPMCLPVVEPKKHQR